MTRFSLTAVALAALTLAACDSNEPVDPTPVALNVQTATDVIADPTNGRDPVTGAPISTGRFTLYSLAENRVVLSYTETDSTARAAVTNSTAWDIGFQGQRIIFNGGASGPGGAVAQLVNTPFDLLTEAPATGYLADGDNTSCTTGLVLCPVTGDEDAWYTYVPFVPGDPNQGGFLSPRAGYSIALRLADGETYAKLRIKSYYQGALTDAQIVPSSRSRYYTFDFVTQPDGSRNFETTTATQP